MKRLLKFAIVLSVVLFLSGASIVLSYTDIGASTVIGSPALSPEVLATIPPSVIDDATARAKELFGDYRSRYQGFVDQLLTAYVEARDKDFVLVFNSGGWGSTLIDKSPGWTSIVDGIEARLAEMGYSSILMSYERTTDSLRGRLEEFVEILRDYPSKTENLAYRVEFLTVNFPNLNVIVAGESNGSVLSDEVAKVLYNEPRVYSIQTGPPFWHRTSSGERKLVLANNGATADTFSQGELGVIVWETFKTMLGLSPPDKSNEGKILFFLKAPGHSYSWDYPEVYSEITGFLDRNFSFKGS